MKNIKTYKELILEASNSAELDLISAVENGNLMGVKRLLKEGVNPDVVFTSRSGLETTPLISAIQWRSIGPVLSMSKAIISASKDIDLKATRDFNTTKTKMSPLDCAVEQVMRPYTNETQKESRLESLIDICRILLEKGADPSWSIDTFITGKNGKLFPLQSFFGNMYRKQLVIMLLEAKPTSMGEIDPGVFPVDELPDDMKSKLKRMYRGKSAFGM